MMISPTASPPSPGKFLYACSTFGDLLGCLARLRVTVEPLPGLEHLGGRPVVPEGISAADAKRLSGPADYEFPVLVEIPADTRCDDDWLAQSVPLSKTGTLVFRSGGERERIVNSMLGDVPVDGLSTRVQPELFERAEAALPAGAPQRSSPGRIWIADAVGGAMCGLLLAVGRRVDCARVLEEGFPGPWHQWPGAMVVLRGLASGAPPTAEQQSLALAAFTVALRLSGKPGVDADGIVEHLSGVLDEWRRRADKETVEAWSRRAREITSWKRALSAVEVHDPVDEKGNVVLRAMLLSLFREQIDHVLEDRVDGELPGARVTLVAAMLVGMRTGLHRCSKELKQPFAATLGELAAAVESPGDAASVLKSCLPTAQYRGHGRSRVLRVADHAGREIAEHPAPEETLLERIVRVLRAGGIAVTTTESQCLVAQGEETVYLSTAAPVSQTPVKAPKKRRAKTAKGADATVAATEAVAAPAADIGGEAKVPAAEPSTARKPRGRRKKTAGAVEAVSASAGAAAVSPESQEPTQTSDLFDGQKPAKD
jgi:hypothetical protein